MGEELDGGEVVVGEVDDFEAGFDEVLEGGEMGFHYAESFDVVEEFFAF